MNTPQELKLENVRLKAKLAAAEADKAFYQADSEAVWDNLTQLIKAPLSEHDFDTTAALAQHIADELMTLSHAYKTLEKLHKDCAPAIAAAPKLSRERRKELLARVVELQNHAANQNQDHVTFTGFFTTEAEFLRHIADLERRAGMSKPKKAPRFISGQIVADGNTLFKTTSWQLPDGRVMEATVVNLPKGYQVDTTIDGSFRGAWTSTSLNEMDAIFEAAERLG